MHTCCSNTNLFLNDTEFESDPKVPILLFVGLGHAADLLFRFDEIAVFQLLEAMQHKSALSWPSNILAAALTAAPHLVSSFAIQARDPCTHSPLRVSTYVSVIWLKITN